MYFANLEFFDEITEAVGKPLITSKEKLGPDNTAKSLFGKNSSTLLSTVWFVKIKSILDCLIPFIWFLLKVT